MPILAVAGQEVALPAWDNVTVIRKPFDLHHVVELVRAELTCAVHVDRIADEEGVSRGARCNA